MSKYNECECPNCIGQHRSNIIQGEPHLEDDEFECTNCNTIWEFDYAREYILNGEL